jgi:hypothetical protein
MEGPESKSCHSLADVPAFLSRMVRGHPAFSVLDSVYFSLAVHLRAISLAAHVYFYLRH